MNDGEPAFPGPWKNDGDGNARAPDGQLVPPDWTVHMQGMTLRDYFAAKAMQALINPKGQDFDRIDEVPKYAYQIADAMLEAREQ
jgi:hypothetical protein